ncbi:MAG: antibiotic biosynthesis monooxygenase [Tannerella sp.]|jgi:quinol monooxygenase YgiN|nr:antibiotic biosynthesis monooxygenase [Tannerella sp.]
MVKNRIILAVGTFLLTMTAAMSQTDSFKGMKMILENVSSKDLFYAPEPPGDMLVRISEIEVYPEYLDEYLKFALTVGATSVREEPGVIAIYPMIQQRDSCQIRILEIYASQEAYRYHIGTRHFQTYKQGTLHMVKQLDLVDMIPMNPSAMPEIFRKLTSQTDE